MKKILMRADDLGFSRAVNYGIYDAVRTGLIRSVGVMVNMEDTQHGVDLLKGQDCCYGLHTNFSSGKPLCTPSEVPSLVEPDGRFHSSSQYRTAKAEFITYEDSMKEISAQYQKFLSLFGHKPTYFEGHAIKSRVMSQALADFAAQNDLFHHAAFASLRIGDREIQMCDVDMMTPDYDPAAELEKQILKLEENQPKIYVFHPGYLDQTILNMSSLTTARTKEAAALQNPATKLMLERNHVECISYETLAMGKA